MPNAQDVLWFKTEFQPKIEAQLAGTPFSVDMVTAFACQETGAIWPALRKKGLPTARILELCVGDTIDASPTGGGRRAFPKNKAELLAAPGGDRMFQVARQGLVDMAEQIPDYRGAAARPDKFCHGFGIFQLDLQFFKSEPDYFLERRYADFDVALARCVGELKSALQRLGWQAKTSLADAEMAAVAIAYNTGRYDPARGLKQGYFDGTKYYGENYFDFLQLAKGVELAAPSPTPTPATRGAARAEKTAAPEPRPAPKKTAAKRPAVKKVAAKRSAVVKKSSAKKGAARKIAAKKGAAKKGAAKKGAPKRIVAKKSAAKKAVAKKAVAKKAVAKKAVAKKAVAKKAVVRKSARRANKRR
jgi:Histone H1-like nucleoprotein HC2